MAFQKAPKGNNNGCGPRSVPKRETAQHFTNYYNAVVDIAEDLGEIKFISISQNDDKKKILLRITEEGIFKNDSLVPMTEIESKAFIKGRKAEFNRYFSNALKERGVLVKYLPILKFASLSDKVSYIDAELKFFIRYKGIQTPFLILPDSGNGGGKMRYMLGKTPINLDEARGLYVMFYPDFLIQTKTALDLSYVKNQIASGQTELEMARKAKEEIGIKTIKENGKVIISADSILSKGKQKGEADEKTKEAAARARAKIFGNH